MDGVIVAYHNTARLFGFQYIPLDDMETCLYGGPGRGDRVFRKCVGLLEEVADEISRVFPQQVRRVLDLFFTFLCHTSNHFHGNYISQSVQCMFETDEITGLHVWVEPLQWDAEKGPCPIVQLDIEATNYLNKDQIEGPQAIFGWKKPCSSAPLPFYVPC